MTDNEIIKIKDLLHRANCIGRKCEGCPYYSTEKCITVAHTHLLRAYIYELQVENDRQKAEIENLRTQLLIRNSVEVRKIKIPKGEPYGHKDPVGEPGTPGPCGFAENCNHVREGKSRSNQRVCGEVESDSYMRFRVEHVEYYDKPSIEKMVLFIDDNDIDNLVKEMVGEG